MPTWGWILIVIGAAIVAGAVVAAALRTRQSRGLRERFGPEYDRVAADAPSRREAEAELREREQRHDQLDLRPLDPSDRDRFRARWEEVQARFVDDPPGAVGDADRLIQEVMRARGYPVDDFDSRAADLSGIWLKPYMRARQCRAGTILFRKGDPADRLYFLAEGRIEFVEIGAIMEPGRIFGEVALFSPERKRTLTARCVDKCKVLSIDEASVEQLYFQNPAFGFKLIGLVAGRLSADVRRLEDRLANAASA